MAPNFIFDLPKLTPPKEWKCWRLGINFLNAKCRWMKTKILKIRINQR